MPKPKRTSSTISHYLWICYWRQPSFCCLFQYGIDRSSRSPWMRMLAAPVRGFCFTWPPTYCLFVRLFCGFILVFFVRRRVRGRFVCFIVRASRRDLRGSLFERFWFYWSARFIPNEWMISYTNSLSGFPTYFAISFSYSHWTLQTP